jgi:hypothetical protein
MAVEEIHARNPTMAPGSFHLLGIAASQVRAAVYRLHRCVWMTHWSVHA